MLGGLRRGSTSAGIVDIKEVENEAKPNKIRKKQVKIILQ